MIDLMDYEIVQESDVNSTAFDTAVIVKDFDPENFTPPAEGDLLMLTTGDVSINDSFDMLDLGADLNGVHFVYKEFQVVTGKPASTLTLTGASFDITDVKRALAAADIDGNQIKTRLVLKATDFENITVLIHKKSGWIACVMRNTLSTGGLAISTSKRGIGKNALTFTAYRSINDKTKPEIDYYFFSTGNNSVVISEQPENVAVAEGTATSFSVTATGATSYQWQVQTPTDKGFVNISGATSTTLSLAASDVTDEANGNRYRCKLTNSEGSAYTVPAVLTVTDGV